MKKMSVIKILMVFAILVEINLYPCSRNLNAKQKIRVVIDAGHGGIDGGATNEEIKNSEAEINLQIALKLKSELKSSGYDVFMIRETDTDMLGEIKNIQNRKRKDLLKRVEIRNEYKPDVFISIHINKFTDSKQRGAQVWYADNIKSEIFAKNLQKNLKEDLYKENRREPKNSKESYRILTDVKDFIAVLVECGFISNFEEAQLLVDENYQEKISKSIKRTIDEEFKK